LVHLAIGGTTCNYVVNLDPLIIDLLNEVALIF